MVFSPLHTTTVEVRGDEEAAASPAVEVVPRCTLTWKLMGILIAHGLFLWTTALSLGFYPRKSSRWIDVLAWLCVLPCMLCFVKFRRATRHATAVSCCQASYALMAWTWWMMSLWVVLVGMHLEVEPVGRAYAVASFLPLYISPIVVVAMRYATRWMDVGYALLFCICCTLARYQLSLRMEEDANLSGVGAGDPWYSYWMVPYMVVALLLHALELRQIVSWVDSYLA